MRLSTLLAVAKSGQLGAINTVLGLTTPLYRATWLAVAGQEGLLALLAAGPADRATIADSLQIGADHLEALGSWLHLGVDLGDLHLDDSRYALASTLARRLATPENDAVLAILQEVVDLHGRLLRETPARLRERRPFTLADQDGAVVARSSRVVEPFIHDVVADFVPSRGRVRLLEIGCGTGTHLRAAASRNPELSALGLELQPEVSDLARANLEAWGLSDRITVESGDVLLRHPEPAWDLATLHQNIYYFAVDARVDLLRHVAGFLVPGGRLLLTTVCRGGSAMTGMLDLWGAATEGAGRLPDVAELATQLEQAGYSDVRGRRILPGESLYAFSATRAAP